MPKPQEICIVIANGERYDIWEIVEVTRSAENIIDHALLTVSEISTAGGTGFSHLKLSPGDVASINLGGVNALTGYVYLRQAAYDKNTHAVQIGICSKTQPVIRTSVDGVPGQYLKQNIQQIGSACFGKVGVGFKVVGAPAGADMIFERISETIGESRFTFIENLCRLRNLHMIDDGKGNIEAYRGPQGNSAPLQEGVNILKGRVLLKIDDANETVTGFAQNFRRGAAGAYITATKNLQSPFAQAMSGNFNFVASNAADKPSLQMNVNHVGDANMYKTVDGCITVQGWFVASGDLWMKYVRKTVTVNSPMLIPGGSMTFVIKEVTHRQSTGEGTTTDILITNQNGLGMEPTGAQTDQNSNPQLYNGPV
jgi:prophage tail gpP-like protein